MKEAPEFFSSKRMELIGMIFFLAGCVFWIWASWVFYQNKHTFWSFGWVIPFFLLGLKQALKFYIKYKKHDSIGTNQ